MAETVDTHPPSRVAAELRDQTLASADGGNGVGAVDPAAESGSASDAYEMEFDACMPQLARMLEDALATTRRERHVQPLRHVASLLVNEVAKREPWPPAEQVPSASPPLRPTSGGRNMLKKPDRPMDNTCRHICWARRVTERAA